jgi:polysaccharide export outer membrane protein
MRRLWVRRLGDLALVATLLGAAACASAPARQGAAHTEPSAGYAFAPWTDQAYVYRIGAGDGLALRFLVNPDLNAEIVVGPDGRAALPLLTTVRLQGMTIDEANQALSRYYGAVLRQPQVQTLVTSYAAGQVYVGGEVRQPGAVAIRGPMRASQAIMSAGGFQETAGAGKVALLRQRPEDGRVMLLPLDMKSALRAQDGTDVTVQPGDVIFVPRSSLSEVNLFVRQFTGALPFTLNYSVNRNGAF